MRIRIVLLILAIIFGIAAVISVMIYLNNVKASIVEEEELFPVVVASQNILKEMKVSDMLLNDSTEVREIPKKYMVEEALDSLDRYEDYIAKVDIKTGEQITEDKLGKIEDLRISFAVPEGYLAVSVPYEEIRGVSNLINVGDKVNVIVTLSPDKEELVLFNKDWVTEMLLDIRESEASAGQVLEEPSTSWFPTEKIMDEDNYILYPQTKIILWNIDVLYIGSKIISPESEQNDGAAGNKNTKPEEVKTVTLAVTPEQAERLVFSEELGKVWFALVPSGGIDEEETSGRNYLNIYD
jgi:Flp pilus assembly protein CpaB